MRFLLISLWVMSASLRGEALSSSYAAKASARGLAQDKTWQRLLFYEQNSLIRGPHGLIDDPDFYLAVDGKTDPEAELKATLEAFFQAPQTAEPDAHALCRFPARRHYLEQQLEGLTSDLPPLACPRFAEWWKDRSYESMSLVFSSFYPDNPASMFGHVFLRLHRSKARQTSDLLDDSVNFAAFTNTSNPILYNVRGAFGGFPGRFSLMPYYMKIQEYNNLESRDLWEYPLQANQEQIQRLLRSLWEFGPHFANYYYFDDNCSYVMLMLMETADIQWDFTSKMRVWATPSACLKAVVDQPGLIQKTHFRASALSRYQERYDALDPEEQKRLARMIANQSSVPQEPSVRVLDSVLEYIDFQEKLGGTQTPVRFASLRDGVLLQRVQNRQPPETLQRMPEDRDPRLAVPESWIMLSGAERDADPFFRLSWQPVLHDLLGERRGYADDMQLQIMPMTFSLDPKTQIFTLDKLDLIHVISAQPYNRLLQPGSWSLEIGYDRRVLCQSAKDGVCPEAQARYGKGASLQLGQGAYSSLAAAFMSVGLGGERADGRSLAFAQAGPEFLLSGITPWSQSYAWRTSLVRRWKADGYADWYAKTEAEIGLRVARLQQARLQASWEQKNSGSKGTPQSDIQVGMLQYF